MIKNKSKICLILIDVWKKYIDDMMLKLPDNVRHFENNLKLLVTKFEEHGIDMVNANYYNRKNFKERQLPIYLRNKDLISKEQYNESYYDEVFICGLSLDSCVLFRDLGYFKNRCKKRTVVIDACLNQNPLPSYEPRVFLANKFIEKYNLSSNEITENGLMQKYVEFVVDYYDVKTIKTIKTSYLLKMIDY